ncbi:hypothetical protein ACUSIJ_28925 [Pseudochelatococcus sp. B33]
MLRTATNDDATRDEGARIFNPVAVAIGHIRLDADLAELRKIAEQSPDLAHKIVDQRLRETENERWRYALGAVIVAGLAALLFATWRGAKRG